MASELGFELVKAFVILDDTGNRICAKYYTDDLKDAAKQSALLAKLPRRCDSTEANVQIIDNRLIVFKGSPGGVIFYVVGAETENEMILTAVLEGAFTTLDQLLRHSLDARTLLDNLELVLLTVDEVIDDGVILEIDPKAIRNRVLMTESGATDQPIGDMTISEALEKAKEQAQAGGLFSFGRRRGGEEG
eukprot:g3720.t1